MLKKDPLEYLYTKDDQSSCYIVQVAINDYADIFNDLDPTPYKGRDLDPDLKYYIDDCSADIPLKYQLKIQFNLPRGEIDEKKEKKIIDGLRTYYSFLSYSSKRDYKKKLKFNIYNIAVAIIFLSLSFFFESFIPSNIIFFVLLEGLYIGGWVFLWRAFSMFAFEYKDITNEYKIYNRIYESKIVFVNQDK